MKLWIHLLAAMVLIAGMSLMPANAVYADEQGWGMMINSPHAGILYLYITSEGFALVVKETGAKFVTHSPDWRLVMYNDKTQVYYVERIDELQSATGNSKNNKAVQAVQRAGMETARAGRTETIAGLTATQIFSIYSPDSGQRQAEIWIAPEIQPPVQLDKTFEKVFNLDMSSGKFPRGMPLRIKVADEAGKQEVVYDTLSCQRQMIRTASFYCPQNYKRVDSELAVLMDESSRKKMESILDDSDDLSSLLNSSSSPGNTARTAAQPAAQATRYASRRPAAAMQTQANQANTGASTAAQKKQSSGDWWSNMFNSMGK